MGERDHLFNTLSGLKQKHVQLEVGSWLLKTHEKIPLLTVHNWGQYHLEKEHKYLHILKREDFSDFQHLSRHNLGDKWIVRGVTLKKILMFPSWKS